MRIRRTRLRTLQKKVLHFSQARWVVKERLRFLFLSRGLNPISTPRRPGITVCHTDCISSNGSVSYAIPMKLRSSLFVSYEFLFVSAAGILLQKVSDGTPQVEMDARMSAVAGYRDIVTIRR